MEESKSLCRIFSERPASDGGWQGAVGLEAEGCCRRPMAPDKAGLSVWQGLLVLCCLLLICLEGRPAGRIPIRWPPSTQCSVASASSKIGRASCRERVFQYVSISVVAVSLKTKT